MAKKKKKLVRKVKKAPAPVVEKKPERRLSTGMALHIVRAERRALQELVEVALHCFETGRLEEDGVPLLVMSCVPDVDMVNLAKESGVDVASVVKDVEAWKRIYPEFEL